MESASDDVLSDVSGESAGTPGIRKARKPADLCSSIAHATLASQDKLKFGLFLWLCGIA